MPLCGTFHYVGVVPEPSLRQSGTWTVTDVSGADAVPRPRPARARWAWSLGDGVLVQGGTKLTIADIDRTPFPVTWVDVSIAGQTARLHDGDEVALAGYRMTLVTANGVAMEDWE